MNITIPKGLTAQQIIKNCDNKTSQGTPVLWSINWYAKEDFYTTEETRGGTFDIEPLAHKGKSWNACKKLETDSQKMLSFPELLYVMVEHEKQTGERFLDDYNYSWTSSRASGGDLVIVGRFVSDGAYVNRDSPDYSFGFLGVLLARMSLGTVDNEIVNTAEASSRSGLEARVQELEEWRARLSSALTNAVDTMP